MKKCYQKTKCSQSQGTGGKKKYMKYATEHMAFNMLKWHRDRKASRRRLHNASGALRAKGLLNRMDKEAGRK